MLRRALALTEEGYRSLKKGVAACVLANLVLMAPVAILFLVSAGFVNHLSDASSPLPSLGACSAVVAVALAAMYATQYLEYQTTYSVVYQESARKRVGIAERLRLLPLSFFGRRDLSDLTTIIMKDTSDQERLFSHVVPQLFGTGISTAVVAAALFAFDWRLAAAALWPIPVAVAALLLSARGQNRAIARRNEAALDLADGIQEFLECGRTIRSINQAGRFLDKLDGSVDAFEAAKLKSEFMVAIPVSGAQAFLKVGVATVILVGSFLVMSAQCDFLVFLAFLLVVTRVYDPVNVVLESIAELIDMLHNLGRMRELEEAKLQEGSTSFDPKGHAIAFENVSFSYAQDGDKVLSGISFTAEEGQVTALVGPSGSGKSTVAKLAARFWDVDEGRVTLGGVDISTIDPETLLADYAEVFQDVVLFDASVKENIRIGRRDATDEEVFAAARAANCDEFAARLADGYDTMIGENGSKLSGGERQRISIARALLKDAKVVLLDEATASLDVENETQVQAALSRLLEGKTVLVIAHRMRTIEAADKIVVLSEGGIVEQGSPQELLARGGMFAHMVELQKETACWNI